MGIPETEIKTVGSSLPMLSVVRKFVLMQLTIAPEVMDFFDV
jgi:hypothetical protein